MWSFIAATVLTTGFAPVVIWWYRRQKWVDDPEKHHHVKVVHTRPLPRGGGLVVLLPILVCSLILLPLTPTLVTLLVGAVILGIVGVLDDIYDLHPGIRIVVNIGVAMLAVATGIKIGFVTHPLQPGVILLEQASWTLQLGTWKVVLEPVAQGLAILYIVWNMNSINWSKGVDGQMPGFVSMAALTIAWLSLRFGADPTQYQVTHLSYIVAGAYAGLLFWNWYPQKLLPGYGAGSLAGYFLAILSILAGAKLATTLMVLAIPTADGIFTITRRILAGKSPWWGDRGHLHHKLMDVLGWSPQKIALFYWGSSLALGLLSLYLNTWGKLITIATVSGFVFSFLVWAKLFSNTKTRPKASI